MLEIKAEIPINAVSMANILDDIWSPAIKLMINDMKNVSAEDVRIAVDFVIIPLG